MGKARAGAVVVFTLLCTVSLWAAWRVQPGLKEAPGKGHAYDDFGRSVSMGGNVLVVGAPQAKPPGATDFIGAAFIFVKTSSGWPSAPTAVLSESLTNTEGDGFGGSVAISPDGTTVVVGANDNSPGCNQQGAGAAFVFVIPTDLVWKSTDKPSATLCANNGMTGDEFGTSVAISSDYTVVVGATQVQSYGPGAAYVFAYNSSSTPPWGPTQNAELTASNGVYGYNVGTSVAVEVNTVVVGAPYATPKAGCSNELPPQGTVECGVAYVFVKGASGWPVNETAQLYASDGTSDDQLGTSVAISGKTIVAGAPDHPATEGLANRLQGAVYVFDKPLGSGGWVSGNQTAELTASDGAEFDELGSAVAINGNIVIAGAPGKTVGSNEDQGKVYVFQDMTTGWAQTAGLVLAAGASNDRLGYSVSSYRSATVPAALVAGAPFRSIPTSPTTSNLSQGEAFVWQQ